MITGFTMIKVLRKDQDHIYKLLKNLNGVKEVHPVLGEYSLFVVIRSEDNQVLSSIAENIANTDGVIGMWHLLTADEGIRENTEFAPNIARTRRCVKIPGALAHVRA